MWAFPSLRSIPGFDLTKLSALGAEILGAGPGDEVVTSTLTFSATVNPIVYRGATPVFIDSSPGSWNMDPGLLEEELASAARRGKLPKAVIAVDLYGQSADYDPILAACRRHDVPLVEDAAEALGATYRGKAAGTLGDLGVYSFNATRRSSRGSRRSDARAIPIDPLETAHARPHER